MGSSKPKSETRSTRHVVAHTADAPGERHIVGIAGRSVVDPDRTRVKSYPVEVEEPRAETYPVEIERERVIAVLT